MKQNNYKKDLDFLIKLVKESAEIIENGQMEVKDKGKNDLVTNLDYAVEKYIIEQIKTFYPHFDIVSEEFNSKKEITENCFTIDPIDGTINFAHGLPYWAIQISCIREGKIVAAVIYSPCTNQLFSATLGGGAFCNDKQIFVNNLPLNRNIFTAHGNSSQTPLITKIYEKMNGKASNYRRIGSTSLSFAYLAKGSLGGMVILSPTIWDDTPGLLICQEAGAKIKRLKDGFIVAGSSDEFIETTSKIINEII